MGQEVSELVRGGLLGPIPALAREVINPAVVAPMATPAAILKTFRRVVPSMSISLMISLFSMFVSPLIQVCTRNKIKGSKENNPEIPKRFRPLARCRKGRQYESGGAAASQRIGCKYSVQQWLAGDFVDPIGARIKSAQGHFNIG